MVAPNKGSLTTTHLVVYLHAHSTPSLHTPKLDCGGGKSGSYTLLCELNRPIVSIYLSEDFPLVKHWLTIPEFALGGFFPFLGTFIFTFEKIIKNLIILASVHHFPNAMCSTEYMASSKAIL